MKIKPRDSHDAPGITPMSIIKAQRYDRDKANGRHVIAGEGNFTLRLLKRPGLHGLIKRISMQEKVTMTKWMLDVLQTAAREQVPTLREEDEGC